MTRMRGIGTKKSRRDAERAGAVDPAAAARAQRNPDRGVALDDDGLQADAVPGSSADSPAGIPPPAR